MPDFQFIDPGTLVDEELELVLTETKPGDSIIGRVPYYTFDMRVGGRKAGYIRLRVGNTPDILMYGGHIGYAIEPEFRGRHYAERASRLILPLAKAHGLNTIWITCDPDNIASRRTIERLGAKLVEIVKVPPYSVYYRAGARAKCRFRLDI
mgnify:FL=1